MSTQPPSTESDPLDSGARRRGQQGSFWLALRFPEAWFESRCPADELADRPPAVLLASRSGTARITAVNAAAVALGITPGQTPLAARSRHQERMNGTGALHCLTEDAAGVDAWLAQLGEWARQYTSRVCRPDNRAMPGLLLELGRSATLFGGLEKLVAQVLRDLRRQHLVVCPAGAPHPRVAWALARDAPSAGDPEPATCPMLDRRRQIAAVCRLPLSLMDWPAKWIAGFREMGLSLLGEVQRLPRDGLAMRYESALLEDLGRLFAERDWPLPTLESPTHFSAQVSLWDPADQVGRLLLLARGPLVQLADFLRHRQLLLSTFEVRLCHEEGADARLEVRTAEVGRDARAWQEQLLLRLQACRELSPVHRIQVSADAFVSLASASNGQARLFEMEDDRWRHAQALWHRLRARLGERAVGRVRVEAELTPSRQSSWVPLDAPISGQASPPMDTARPARPFWWLAEPRPLESGVADWGEIERVQTAWWQLAEESADYRPATLESGRSVWVRRPLEPSSGKGAWRVMGLGG